MEDFEVVISENEKEYFYLLNDAVKKSFVKIVKKDAETGNVIPVSGIGFKVWDCANSEYISQKIYYPSEMILDTFYTDESGSLMPLCLFWHSFLVSAGYLPNTVFLIIKIC